MGSGDSIQTDASLTSGRLSSGPRWEALILQKNGKKVTTMKNTIQNLEWVLKAYPRVIQAGLCLVFGILSMATAVQSVSAATYHETVLHKFTGYGFDGDGPLGPTFSVVRDKAGNSYGTTQSGGAYGYGSVFKIDANGKTTTIHSFPFYYGNGDGAQPNGGLVIDAAGNIYGTTFFGGDVANCGTGGGCGVVFELRPTSMGYKEKIVHTFEGGAKDGANAFPTLIMDPSGNLYGTTWNGGTGGAKNGDGVLYELDTAGKIKVLYNFGANPDEGTQVMGLARDSQGNFYATSETGGPNQYSTNCIQTNFLPSFGCGTLVKIDPNGNETLLHVFTGVNGDGGSPMGAVTIDAIDASGNIFGTTLLGGAGSCQPGNSSTPGCGTIFEIDSSGNYSVIHSFPGAGQKGAGAIGALVEDAAGDLYGATEDGGLGTCGGGYSGGPGCGTIFKLDVKTGAETLLHEFADKADGAVPESGLTGASDGSLYGTTAGGGATQCGCGVVFKIATQVAN